MIIWIAGWPHNGSTLCRQILKDAFEIPTVSCYLESELESLFPGAEAFFHRWYNNAQGMYNYVIKQKETYVIKTHELPSDGSHTVFVYRDGRDAVTALSNFWKISLRNSICGINGPFGTWSSYYHGWNPKSRPNTLMLKYEDMVEKPNDIARQISAFFKIEQKHEYIDDFEEKKKEFPYLFKDRVGAWKKKLKGNELDLFWRCHGAVMKELGYAR